MGEHKMTSSTYIKIVKPRSTPEDPPTKGSVRSRVKIQEDLESEFCPPLDSTLVAALLMDTQHLSESSIIGLKSTLKQLAAVAHEDMPNSPRFASRKRSESDVDGQDVLTSLPESLSRSLSLQGSSLPTSNSLSSPIAFLRTAFPNLPTKVLEITLRSHGWSSEVLHVEDDGPYLDMDAIISDLLSKECHLENEDVLENTRDIQWEMVQKSRKIQGGNVDTNGIGSRKGKRQKPKPLPLVDVLQRQHSPIPRPAATTGTEALDPWSSVDSLSVYLSTLLPRITHSQLLSLFHNPSHATPIEALRAYLNAPLPASTQRNGAGITDIDVQALAELLSAHPDDPEVRSNLDRDAKACLNAVDGDMSKAYDLLVLLKDLEANGAAIRRSFTSPKRSVPELPPGPVTPKSAAVAEVPSIPSHLAHSVPASPPPAKSTLPSLDAWTIVDKKRRRTLISESPAVDVPSCWTLSRMNRRDGSERDAETPEECKRKAGALQLRRKQALDQASIHWKKKNRLDGEAALYYAEKARDLDAESRSWALRGARAHVEIDAHRRFGGTTIDVHGLTVDEGVIVSKEHVNNWWSSIQAGNNVPRTFTIITGVGKHSAGPGKLGPALEFALKEDGWDVRKEQGRLVITGVNRRPGRR